ncbi:serine hydrolase domain-containing protein [Niabella sp. 22666]|uniref:serine hydrolase domain-containing protein n=1 Tax=Niabella sp. 22666 TaxID=3453954 RepID=UPI003F84E565
MQLLNRLGSFRTNLIVLLLLLLFGTVVARAQTIKRLDGSLLKHTDLTREIQHLVDTARVTGLGIIVFNNNRPVYSHTFGYANASEKQVFTDTSHLYGASFSKAVFAYLVMQLAGEGIIDLDKPLVQYLPQPLLSYTFPGKLKDYRDLAGDRRYEKITARMCLAHTTGFPNFRWFEPDNKLRIKFEPGTRVSYSGEGMYLLQVVIQEIMHTGLETLAEQRIFKPLNMKQTSYIWQPRFEERLVVGHDAEGNSTGFPRRPDANAAGSMITTLNDYGKFYTAMIQSRSLKPGLWKEMTTAQIRIHSVKQFGPLSWRDTTMNDAIQLAYGLGFGVIHSPYGRGYFKEGNDRGWGHYSIAFPDRKIAIVIMTNSDNGEGIFRDLLQYAIGDHFTPWYWENYIPWQEKKR